jgi:hypothetical protein
MTTFYDEYFNELNPIAAYRDLIADGKTKNVVKLEY